MNSDSDIYRACVYIKIHILLVTYVGCNFYISSFGVMCFYKHILSLALCDRLHSDPSLEIGTEKFYNLYVHTQVIT